MRKWEEIVKDKLEEPDGTLPERVFAEFHTRLDGAEPVPAPNPARKLSPLVWIMAASVAAGLAAVLFLRRPESPADSIHIVDHPMTPVASITDSSVMAEQLPSSPLIAQAVAPKTDPQVSVRIREVITPQQNEPEEDITTATLEEENKTPGALSEAEYDSAKKETKDETASTTTPYIPQDKNPRAMQWKVAPAAGIAAGSSLLATVVYSMVGANEVRNKPSTGQQSPKDPLSNIYALRGYSGLEGYSFIDESIGRPTHLLPFKGGLSVGIPVAGRWKITTGLEYSLYPSCFTSLYSGEKKQYAHYLGVPVRMDWILGSTKWLDVYLGGGLEGDCCISATLAGEPIKKDGFSLSFLGAAGVQVNVARHIGIYVEPELSWRIPSEKNLLQTYRSEHSFLFSVATGFRINLED